MIGRNHANKFANQAGADLHLAQQEIVLTYALQLLVDRGILSDAPFKGGTYLRKMVLGDSGRISEDLDLTNVGLPADPQARVRAALKEPFHGIRFGIREPYATRTGWACTVTYAHAWDEGGFKLEVSQREKPFLPVEHRDPVPQPYFPYLEFLPSPVPCLPVEEAMAEKLRALQQRATERDLYDVVQYSHRKVNPELTRLLAVAKMWSVREPYSGDDLLETLRTGRRDWPDLNLLIPRSRQRDWNAECRRAANRLAYLADTVPFDRAVIEDSRRHHLARPLQGRIRSLAGHALPP